MELRRKGIDTYLMRGGVEVARMLGAEGYEDRFEPAGEGVLCWERRGPATAQMRMAVRCAYEADYTMLPALNYDGNGWGTFCEYVGDRYQGEPWRYGWHRATAPGMTYSEGIVGGNPICLALFGEAVGRNCMSLYRERGATIHALQWPEDEGPRTLLHYRYGPPYRAEIEPRECFTAWIAWDRPARARQGYRRALDAAWALGRRDRPMPRTPGEVCDLGIDYARQLYTEEPDGFCGFNIGLAWEDGAWRKRTQNKYEIGWCGQNASLANAFLWRALQTGDARDAEAGFRTLDSWIERAHLPIGVLHSYYDPGQDRYLEACNTGTAGLMYFEAADLARALGADRPVYERAAMEICEFAISRQREDGCLAKCWKEDGSVAIAEGTVGAYMVMPLAEAYRRTGERRYLDAAVRSYRYYHGELARQGFTTAGALDIFSIDKESAIPLLKAAISLHGTTGAREWLDCAEDAAWYLSTWQSCYTMEYPRDSLLTQMRFDTHGGTITSTVHEGMDPFALCYVPDLFALWAATGQRRWWERAQAAWRNGCQCISDGSLVIDGKVRPRGSQDEAFLVTRQGGMGRPTQWLVAWPGAFRMEAVRRMHGLMHAKAFFDGEACPV